MQYRNTIIAVLLLIVCFAIIFGWWLMKCCRRVVDVKVHEVQYRRDLEAQIHTLDSPESAKGSKKSSKKSSKAGGSKK
ncbi:hypothetical protein ACN47E_001335 [Coniothyrium glycines]